MRQLLYTIFITNNHASFHLLSKEILAKIKKSQYVMTIIVLPGILNFQNLLTEFLVTLIYINMFAIKVCNR